MDIFCLKIMIDRCTHQVLELAVSLCCFRRWGWKNKVNIWNLLLMFAHANLGRDFLNKFRDLKFLSLELFHSRLSSFFIRHYIHSCFVFVGLVSSTDCHVPSLNSWFMIFSSFYAYLLNGMCGTEYFNLTSFSEHGTDRPVGENGKIGCILKIQFSFNFLKSYFLLFSSS